MKKKSSSAKKPDTKQGLSKWPGWLAGVMVAGLLATCLPLTGADNDHLAALGSVADTPASTADPGADPASSPPPATPLDTTSAEVTDAAQPGAEAEGVPDLRALRGRLQKAVSNYEKLLKELNLDHLPGQMAGYVEVTEGLERLGARLEPLSRMGGQLFASESGGAWQALGAAVAQWEADLAALRRQALPLRLWSHLTARGIKRPGWGVGLVAGAQVLARDRREVDAEVGDSLSLSGVAGERIAGQLVVVPLAEGLKGVQATAGKLKGPGGVIPSDQVRLVNTGTLPLPAGGEWDLIALSASSAPLSPGATDLGPEEAAAWLIIISQPPDLAPGLYQGSVAVGPAKIRPLNVMLTVEVEAPLTAQTD